MSSDFDSDHCHCADVGLCAKPHGRCLRYIGEDTCPFECEQSLLGTLMYDDDALDRVDDLITPAHFVWPCHGKLYQIFANLIRDGKRCTYETVAPLFAQRGGMPIGRYLDHLLINAASILTIREYADRIVERVALASLKETA